MVREGGRRRSREGNARAIAHLPRRHHVGAQSVESTPHIELLLRSLQKIFSRIIFFRILQIIFFGSLRIIFFGIIFFRIIFVRIIFFKSLNTVVCVCAGLSALCGRRAVLPSVKEAEALSLPLEPLRVDRVLEQRREHVGGETPSTAAAPWAEPPHFEEAGVRARRVLRSICPGCACAR